ncbi:non-ribosomal peptide synthetase [Mangrovihabitans endophyticus]|uniref:Carrier domain-containing protein n=1 Tax=Mangrovihabitans endophyticus TaxID=1751298 RepID=A0A8J3BW49_9ACTN|nr:non-ribosomal peptide synthetase [Mangrovihabitans endophyticus]GGK79010.1 hypothetical protein GCM10012284_11220 [Mangrovihabitans endophyticus]
MTDPIAHPAIVAMACRFPGADTPEPTTADARLRPASQAQRRLWFLDELSPASTAYHVALPLRLRGPLDVAELRRALTETIGRHESLRTTFELVDGDLYQRIAPAGEAELPVVDLTGVPESDREAAAVDLADAEAAKPFHLDRAPLVRVVLGRLADDDHVLCLTCHHIVCDGQSIGILFAELSARYPRDAAPLPALPMQFADHAQAERDLLDDARLQKSLQHWRETLTGAPELLELPSSRSRPAVQGHAADTRVAPIDPLVWTGLLRVAREHNVTAYMALLAAYAALLSRLTGADDVVIGSPAAGRGRHELEPLIGMFVNTLPLRIDLSGEPSYRELLGRVRRTTLDAITHQQVPLETILNEVRLTRATSYDPLFQTTFALEPPLPRPAIDGVAVEILPAGQPDTYTDMRLDVRAEGDAAVAYFRYRTELFASEDVRRLAGQFQRVLAAVVADPDVRVPELELLSREERAVILRQWSRSGPAYPWQGPVHEWIWRQAALAPGAVAVVTNGETVSYADLIHRADRLAATLVARGAGRGPVALCLPRGTDLVVAILAVMRAGAAFMPLATDDPANRLTAMIEHAGAMLVLADERHAGPLRQAGVTVLDPGAADDDPALPEPPEVTPGDLAYVLHTSGSTGTPKPVAVPHRGLANRITHLRRSQGLTAQDRALYRTPYTFDVSVEELLLPLVVGAAVVPARPGDHRDTAHLADLIERTGVTTATFVPPLLEAFLAEPAARRCRSLRRVLCFGQALTTDLRDEFLRVLPWARLVNCYGPTEASIAVTEWECRPGDRSSPVPIGRPMPGAEIYVLDERLQPVPVGVAGELLLGGVALARGYLGRPDLTADRFVPHPFATGERLYRTGDVVRWRADAALEYLGRNDRQLKVRGIRVEPDEVVGVLRRHPGVREAVVTVAETGVVAYVVPAGDDADLERAVLDHARAWLPRYLVPVGIAVVPAVPLTRSGKTDISALPPVRPPAVAKGRAPEGSTECALAGIWGALLGREPGAEDDVFTLGAESLMSIRAVQLARAAGIMLSVEDVFRCPSVAEQAATAARRVAEQ